jgi:hypothetical protein
MKTNVLILIIAAMICISSTVVSTQIFKPAKPISTASYYLDAGAGTSLIVKKAKEGWIVKAAIPFANGNSSQVFIVLEKY